MGSFRVRGGVLPPRTVPRTFRGLLLCRAHPCTCSSRCAHCVHRCAGSFVSVSLLHMFPFSNIIHSRSNVLLPMSQSRPLQMLAQSLLILLFPTLNTNIMLHAILVVGIAHGICVVQDLAKALMLFHERISTGYCTRARRNWVTPPPTLHEMASVRWLRGCWHEWTVRLRVALRAARTLVAVERRDLRNGRRPTSVLRSGLSKLAQNFLASQVGRRLTAGAVKAPRGRRGREKGTFAH